MSGVEGNTKERTVGTRVIIRDYPEPGVTPPEWVGLGGTIIETGDWSGMSCRVLLDGDAIPQRFFDLEVEAIS